MAITFKSTKLLSRALKGEQDFIMGLKKFIIPAAYLDDVAQELWPNVYVLGRIGDEEDDWLFMIIGVNRESNIQYGLEVILRFKGQGTGQEIFLTPVSGKKETIQAKDRNGISKTITFTQETAPDMPSLH